MDTTVRLDKHLSSLGVCARRAVDDLLKQKIVSVNGKRITESGIRINPAKDIIRIDGKELSKPALEYYLLNKPKGVTSTTSDPHADKTVVDLIKTDARIYPVGRLDRETSGLIILTNDGDFTNKLTHPRYEKDKTYRLTISGSVSGDQIEQFESGVQLEDGMTAPAKVEVRSDTTLDITIHEGKNRQIRKMCQALGINLIELERIAIGTLSDPSLKAGEYRTLSVDEIDSLLGVV